jgi:hypothetical protein
MLKSVNWKDHFIQFVSVLIGVSLAFVLNSWYIKNSEKEEGELYFEGVISEIVENKKEVERKLNVHKKLLNVIYNSPDSAIIRLSPSNLKHHAWDISENNTFRKSIDYDLYLLLVETYDTQNTLTTINSKALDLLYELNIHSPLQWYQANVKDTDSELLQNILKQGWMPIFEDIISLEKELINNYTKILDLLESSN